jgi:hypothetical protein
MIYNHNEPADLLLCSEVWGIAATCMMHLGNNNHILTLARHNIGMV